MVTCSIWSSSATASPPGTPRTSSRAGSTSTSPRPARPRPGPAASSWPPRPRTLDLRLLHTSVLTRAIRTAELALAAAGRSWLPVRRDWRLNERHYGDLQGKNKAEIKQQFGAEQLGLWRRSYDTPPPPLSPDNP